MANNIVRIRLDLKGVEAEDFKKIKKHYGVRANAEVVRILLSKVAPTLNNPTRQSRKRKVEVSSQ